MFVLFSHYTTFNNTLPERVYNICNIFIWALMMMRYRHSRAIKPKVPSCNTYSWLKHTLRFWTSFSSTAPIQVQPAKNGKFVFIIFFIVYFFLLLLGYNDVMFHNWCNPPPPKKKHVTRGQASNGIQEHYADIWVSE